MSIGLFAICTPKSYARWYGEGGKAEDNIKLEYDYNNPWERYLLYNEINPSDPKDPETFTEYELAGYIDGIAVSTMLIPDKYNSKPIVKVCNSLNNNGELDYLLEEILFSGNIREIEENTFLMCDSLMEITFRGTGNITIGNHAFNGCSSLTTIHVNQGFKINGEEVTTEAVTTGALKGIFGIDGVIVDNNIK